jgi:hypothetical protein
MLALAALTLSGGSLAMVAAAQLGKASAIIAIAMLLLPLMMMIIIIMIVNRNDCVELAGGAAAKRLESDTKVSTIRRTRRLLSRWRAARRRKLAALSRAT